MRSFTAKDAAKCFPWISPATIRSRILKGIQPFHKEAVGPGSRYEFTHAQLVHIQVVDELMTSTSWRKARDYATVEVTYNLPDPHEKTLFSNASRDKGGLELPPIYYEVTNYNCWIRCDFLRRRSEGAESRRKAGERIIDINYISTLNVPSIGAGIYGTAVVNDELLGLDLCFGSVLINVYKIYEHTTYALGLRDREKDREIIHKIQTEIQAE